MPDGWCWTTIEEVCSKIGSGSTPKGGNYSKEGIPFFRSQNVYNSGIVLTDIKYISNEVHQSMNGTEVVANDLLLNITGGSLGRCAIIPSNFDKGNVSQHVCILRTVLVKPDYLHAFILSSFFAKSMKITGSGREGLPKYNLEKMLLPLPPIKEQERIISETERLQTFVDQIEISEGKLSEFILQAKSKILDLAIHGKLVPQDPTDEPACELLKRINPKAEITCDNPQYGKLPNGWCETTFKGIFKDVSSKPFQILQSQIKAKGKHPVISQSSNFIEGYSDENVVYECDCPIVIFGDHTRNVKYVDFDFIVGADGVKIIKPYIDAKYSYYMLVYAASHIVNKGYSRHSNQISKFGYIVPPLAEQHRIVAKIEELFGQLDKIEVSL